MNPNTTAADFVADLRRERDEAQAVVRKADAVLGSLREFYPELFERPVPSRVETRGDDGEGRLIVGIPQADGGMLRTDAGDTGAFIDYILREADRAGRWMTPKEIADEAVQRGWQSPSDAPVELMRTRIGRTSGLDVRQRDGRTKEYRLKLLAASAGETTASDTLEDLL